MFANRSGVSQPPHQEGTPRAREGSQVAICSGANFGIYVVRELLGIGSTASVYRAHDTRLRREVALKILNTEELAGAAGLARFLHEARMAAAIRHPNVVSIFDVGVHDGTPYIVMELLRGEDLDARLSAARFLREPALIEIALQLVSGLAAVHDAGIVHRDLRPTNVFLARRPDGSTEPKLLDFGLSKQTRDNLRLTTHGRRRWAAMPLYTAPEVLLDGEATFHSDQYSLGVLLYECVTGSHPFRAETMRESIELITTGQARRIADQPQRPSRRLAAIIEKAMHVYPDERFADLRELGRALVSLSGRRVRWPWSSRSEPGAPRAPSASPGARPRPLSLGLPRRSRGEVSWIIGATVIGCSIGAPLVAWWSVHRHSAAAPASVAAPYVPAEGRPLAAVAPAQGPCAVPCPVRVEEHPSGPMVGTGPHASIVPVNAEPAALVRAEWVAPEHAASPGSELAEAPSPAEDVSDGVAMSRDPSAQLHQPASTLSEGSPLDSGVAPSDAGGSLDTANAVGAPSPSAAVRSSHHERGTNGALIFD